MKNGHELKINPENTNKLKIMDVRTKNVMRNKNGKI